MSVNPDTFKIHESLDTNVILRLLLEDNPDQAAAAYSLIKDHPKVTYFLSDFAVAEIIYILERQTLLSRSDIVLQFNYIFENFPNITWNETRLGITFDLYLTHPALSFDDCYLATEAEETSTDPLWTFDHSLARQHPAASLVPVA